MTNIKKVVEYFTNLCYSIFRIDRVKGEGSMALNKRLETLANDILINNDMLKLPVDLTSIAANNKIEVYVGKLPDDISGAIRYNKDKNVFEILVQETDGYQRQRFTVAHELAHFFLQKETLKSSEEIHFDTLYRKEKNEQEREVDYLAGAILMNEEILKRLFKVNSSIKLLADTFEVSEAAMNVRLSILGLK